jgi:hypothetical protein
VLVNNEGKMLVFSSPEAQDAYVEAFADWEQPYLDTERKSPPGFCRRVTLLSHIAVLKRVSSVRERRWEWGAHPI